MFLSEFKLQAKNTDFRLFLKNCLQIMNIRVSLYQVTCTSLVLERLALKLLSVQYNDAE